MDDKQPSSHEMRARLGWGAGLAIGAGVGVALGAAMKNMGLGIAIGMGIGVAFMAAFAAAGSRPKASEEVADDSATLDADHVDWADEPEAEDTHRDEDPEPPARH